MDKFNDFSALKALKKELEERDASGRDAAPVPQKRSRTVIHSGHREVAAWYWRELRFACLSHEPAC